MAKLKKYLWQPIIIIQLLSPSFSYETHHYVSQYANPKIIWTSPLKNVPSQAFVWRIIMNG